ncbi:DUF7210 family protein [Pasteurella multocida]
MKLKLLKPHTHEGKHYQAGAILVVNTFDGNWLIAIGVAKLLKSKKTEINHEN